MAVGCVAQR